VQRKRLPVSVQRSQSERHFQEGMSQRLTNIDDASSVVSRAAPQAAALFRMGLFARSLGRVKLEERAEDRRTGSLSEAVVLIVRVSRKAH
jgi:hypothetical protein